MSVARAPVARWSVVIPYYNEEAFIGPTLASIADQTLAPDQIILVDNGSTDGSRGVAKAFSRARPDLPIAIIEEPAPGKASALKRGLAAVAGEFVATCDADTIYPPAYLETADRLFTEGGERVSAVIAAGVRDGASVGGLLARAKVAVAAALMPSQVHGGGYGQSFRMSALKAAGGFEPELWPYCLMDHEVMHRISKSGDIRHSFDHWCSPSPRRKDRSRVRWTLGERLLYHAVPRTRREWFFYRFLRARFDARNASELDLRAKPWLRA